MTAKALPSPFDGPPGAARPRSRLVEILLLLLFCVPYVVGLAEPPLWDANEPLYAEPPKEALETGDWLAPPWNGRPWFVHPPLSAWLTMPSYALFGVTPFAERLPMAIAAILTILATCAIGRAVAGRRGGIVAAAVLATTARYWLFSRQLAGDVYLTAFLTGAFALTLPALSSGGVKGRGRLLLAYALVGVGTLAKGPVIGVLFLAPYLLAARFSRPRVPLRALRPVAFTLIVLALAAPWFVYMGVRFGREWFDVYVGHQTGRRIISDDLGGRGRGPWFYLLALLGEGQPWILFVPFAIRRAIKRGERDPVRLLAWFAAAFPLVLFSIPVGKRNVYLLPLYPAMAAALAPLFLEAWDGLHERLARASAALLAVAAAGSSTLLVIGAGHVPADIAAGSRVYLVICVVALVAAIAAAFARFRIARGRVVVALTIGFVWLLVLASGLLLPTLGRFMPVPQLARTLIAHAGRDDPVLVYRTSIHSLMFYADRRTSTVQDPAQLLDFVPEGKRAFVLGADERVAEIGLLPNWVVTELARAPYFKFNFDRNIRGLGPSALDLVLLEVRRATADERRAREASGGGVRSPGSK